jgi:hypothetical protein
MKTTKKWGRMLLVGLLGMFLTLIIPSCDSDDSSDNTDITNPSDTDDPIIAPSVPTVSSITITTADSGKVQTVTTGVLAVTSYNLYVPGVALTFSASVAGENNPSQDVTWSVEDTGKKSDTVLQALKW